MFIVVIGPQGSGKGTQSERLAPKHKLLKISTGDLFRAERRTGTDLGQCIGVILDAGLLVPDPVTLNFVRRSLAQIGAGAASGAVFDGFPRNLQQAKDLDAVLGDRGAKIDMVVEIQIPEAIVLDRMEGRRVCPNCGATFHVKYGPPRVEGICDNCGANLEQRKDDTADAIRNRLKTYQTLTAPLLEYYGPRGIVRSVNGNQPKDEVERDIDAAVAALAGAGVR